MGTVLVCGATGTTGSAVLREPEDGHWGTPWEEAEFGAPKRRFNPQ